MKCSFLIPVLLLVGLPASAQQMFRCGATYSQTPCGAGQQALGPPAAPTAAPETPADPATVEAAKAQCVARLTQDVPFKDPESVRVRSVLRTIVQPMLGSPQLARWYVITANAKNGFGGYTGDKTYLCFADPKDEARILSVRPM